MKQASGSFNSVKRFKSTLSTKWTGKSLHFQSGFLIRTACILCIGNFSDIIQGVSVKVYLTCPHTTGICSTSYQYQLSEFLMSAQKSSIMKLRNLYASSVVTMSSVHQVCLLASLIISDGFIYWLMEYKAIILYLPTATRTADYIREWGTKQHQL